MSSVVPPPVPRDERWHWRLAFLAPAVVGPGWVMLGRALDLMQPLPTMAGATVVLLLLAVVYTDIKGRRIPNWATYTAAAWALLLVVLSAVFGEPAEKPLFGAPPVADAVGGFLIGFFVMLALFSVFGGGAGDVKLVAALGGLLGLPVVVMVMFYGYIVAGAFALAFVVWKVGPFGVFRPLGARLFPGTIKPPEKTLGVALRAHVPMAPFLAAGVILAVALG